MPSILDVRHWPDAVVLVVLAVEVEEGVSVVAVDVCAKATVASSAVPARPAAIDFINILSSPSAENLCGENSSDQSQFRACCNFIACCASIGSRVQLFLSHSGTFCSARTPSTITRRGA